MLQSLFTPSAASPGGHYSQAIIHGDTVYISGLLPINPENGQKILGGMDDQLNTVLTNLEAILKAAGSDRHGVIRTTVYIADMALWGEVNAKYVQFLDRINLPGLSSLSRSSITASRLRSMPLRQFFPNSAPLNQECVPLVWKFYRQQNPHFT